MFSMVFGHFEDFDFDSCHNMLMASLGRILPAGTG
jgi:hypothetical protein